MTIAEPARGRESKGTILVADDESYNISVCQGILENAGHSVLTATTTQEALAVIEGQPVDIVLSDVLFPQGSGLDLLQKIRESYPTLPVVMLTQYGTVENAVQAMQLGAADYVLKPFQAADLVACIERVLGAARVSEENKILREQLRSRPGFGGLIGTSVKMQKVYGLIEKVSQHNYPVLILGESGTGKELVARSIHFSGPRKSKPFVPVDCSALVPTLIESELFGYVKGAFTGAMQTRQGLLEAAGDGTLFLDEIADMPVDLQAKLLRVLQEREVKPVGSTDRVPIKVRVIAATNRDLDSAIRNGTFRQDLYFRLNVVQIKLPPLRERKTDIPLLVNYFMERFNEGSHSFRRIADEAVHRLNAYDWPGNVRELENAIARAMALGSGPVLNITDLPSNLQYGNPDRVRLDDDLLPLEELERRAILRALRETGGDKLAAARLLGIGKTTLYRKLKQYEGQRAALA